MIVLSQALFKKPSRFAPRKVAKLKGPPVGLNLFGASGVGEQIAANLTAMIPKVKVSDATAVDVTDDEKDTTPGPGVTQEE